MRPLSNQENVHGDYATSTEATPNQTPKGLTTNDWATIRAEYERRRHAAIPEEGGYRARNFTQQWMMHFDGQGFTVQSDSKRWTWGLELERYGFVGLEREVTGRAQISNEQERIRYAWKAPKDTGIEEWFVNDRRGQ